MNIRILILLFLFLSIKSSGQFVVTTNNYFQDFGTATIPSWTDNTTFLGWYKNGAYSGEEDIDGSTPANAGGLYSYICNGGTDRKIGLRPSNGSGGGPCNGSKTCGHAYGLRFLNNTGTQITSIQVSYDAFQLSEAQDGGNTNFIYFDYRIGTGLNSVGLGQAGWNSIPALDYTAPITNASCGGSQLAAIQCAASQNLTECIPLTVNNGEEIMLRWLDNNNSCNDPHLAIDNVNVLFYLNGTTCVSALPVRFLHFTAERNETDVNLSWATSSEINADYFEVERSIDGENFEHIGYFNASGTTNSYHQYTLVDGKPINDHVSYYRLKQVDQDGVFTYSDIRSVQPLKDVKVMGYYNMLGQEVKPQTSGVVIIRYSDGSSERRYNP